MHTAPDDAAKRTAVGLLAYCRANNWAGYDPYDALNSAVFTALPFLNARAPRIVLTQALKRSPIDLRRLLLIRKTQTPKGLALFVSALLKLQALSIEPEDDLVGDLVTRLRALRSPRVPYWCWGYSFPWQTRTLVVPAGAPNLVCTAFVGHALLDAYEQRQDAECLEMAASAAEYLATELFWSDEAACGFSYPVPGLRTRIHNANLLGAALLCRVWRHTGERRLLRPALAAARSSAAAQRPDGSWVYGDGPNQAWIDNFHTGYNLCALRAIGGWAGTREFERHVRPGLSFYRSHFFREDGAPRYFHDRTYPIDIHCVAQSMITLLTLQDLDAGASVLARAVFDWAMRHMWDERGFFYYRVLRSCTIRTSYMRWSQAWMLLAISTLLSDGVAERQSPPRPRAMAPAC